MGRLIERRISLADAANLVGKRFHGAAWTGEDPGMLVHPQGEAPDPEAWARAAHVEGLLAGYVTSGAVTAYMANDDALMEMPIEWVTPSSFALCIRTGRFRVWTDRWEPIWIDAPSLLAALPPNGAAREKHRFEWKPIVHQAWKFALSEDEPPTKAALSAHLGGWCSEQGYPVPDASALAEVAREVVDFLSENKPGRRLLTSGSLEAPADQSE